MNMTLSNLHRAIRAFEHALCAEERHHLARSANTIWQKLTAAEQAQAQDDDYRVAIWAAALWTQTNTAEPHDALLA
jgi:hypothetical protein